MILKIKMAKQTQEIEEVQAPATETVEVGSTQEVQAADTTIVAALTTKINELEAGNVKLTNELAEALALIEEQQKQLTATEVPVQSNGALVVKLGKVQYEVQAKRFRFKGREHEASELSNNKELLTELVNIGSGILNKIK